MDASDKFQLVTCIQEETPGILPWLAYHRLNGVDDILAYAPPRTLTQTPILQALEHAGFLRCLPLEGDAGSPLKSAIMTAMLDGQLSQGGLCVALGTDEFLRLGSDGQSFARTFGRRGQSLAAWAVPLHIFPNRPADEEDVPLAARQRLTGTSHLEFRTVFRVGEFTSHTGERPVSPKPETTQCWIDGDGVMIHPIEAFWPESQDISGDKYAAIHKYGGEADGGALIGDDRLVSWYRPVQKEVARILADNATKRAFDALIAPKNDQARTENVAADTNAPTGHVTDRSLKQSPPEPPSESDDETPDQFAQVLTDPPPPWFVEIYPGGTADGFMQSLEHHALIHVDRKSETLVVTFDNLSNVNDVSFGRVPWAYKFLKDEGHSHLGVMARRKDWYRDPGLIAALERLANEGFFARFKQVLFAGTSMGGFAALAFSSLSPGANVLAFSPQSTLDAETVPWETRFGMGRIRNWRLPYSDAAFEIESAACVCIISDPYFHLDQRHVDRLKTGNVIKLEAWYSGHFTPVFLRRAELLKPIMSHMIDGTLTAETYYPLYRRRRTLPWYRKALEESLKERGHDKLSERVGPAFRRAALLRETAAE